jgi:hypothetical protein
MLFKIKILKLCTLSFITLVFLGFWGCKPAPLPVAELKEEEVLFPELDIEGIIYDQKDPIAVVNGDLRVVGDEVDGVRIVDIQQKYVTFELKGKTLSVNVKEAVSEVSQGPELPEFSVEGIIFDKRDPVAVINGDVKKVEDIIFGAKIIEIQKNYVLFEYNNEIVKKEVNDSTNSQNLPVNSPSE